MSKNFSDYDNLTSLFTEIRNKNVDIEKNIAPVESDASSSSRVYAVNSRLILGDKLYKVIAAINIGDALIVDTNIELSSNLVTLIGQGGGGGETYYAGPGINISDDNVISSKAVEFAGTQAEWDALSEREKSVFDYINITDDTSEETYQPGHSISDGTSEKTQREVLEFEGFTVTDDSVNGKTKVAEVPYTAGDGVEITEKEISVSDDISRTWTGTTAEWNAIVDKSVYDGWIINITDDQASGIGVVVDAVQDGNMNAVTSNAVATALADKQDKTDNNLTTTAKTVVGGINELKNDLSDLKVTPRLIDASKTMQCDTVYLQSYAYTATKKCVLSMNVKGLFNNGYCTGVKFYVNNALMLTEEHDNQAVSYSYMLNAGDRFIVQVRYSNYTLNEIDQRGFLIEFG